jgi:Ca2+:H+ antiporter
MGAAMLAGGLVRGRKVQKFDRTAANVQSLMLFLAVAAMVMPAIFELVEGQGLPGIDQERVAYDDTVEHLSLAVAIVLIGTYVAGLLFSLRTHSELFNPHSDDDEAHDDTWGWSVRTSVIALAVAGIAVGVMSEILVGSIEAASESVGLSEFFIGVIVVAIVGNAAEHWVAVLVAVKDKMDLSVNIAIGSRAQVAMFVAPVLVLLSFVLGPGPMPLVFNGFEIAAVILGALVAYQVTNEGESTWFEGVQLLALYVILGLTFYFA